jgi:hypothetical protein
MLDTKFLDQSGIQHKMDRSKEELGSSEQEGEKKQSEINTSMVDPPINVDHFPLSPYKVETPPTNETQQEAESPGHTYTPPTKDLVDLQNIPLITESGSQKHNHLLVMCAVVRP